MANYHQSFRDQRSAIDWARYVMGKKRRYVVLDTETTGMKGTDEIIQLAVIDLDGNVLFNENIRPTTKKRISPDAVALHGLTMDRLSCCPTFSDLSRPLKKAIRNRTIITYNVQFDARLYLQTYKLAGGFLPKGNWECAMLEYSKFVGEWNEYQKDYKWQKLKGGDHSALGDCLATLRIIQAMASCVKQKKWYEFWVGE